MATSMQPNSQLSQSLIARRLTPCLVLLLLISSVIIVRPARANDGAVDASFDPKLGIQSAARVSRLLTMDDGSVLAVANTNNSSGALTGMHRITAAGEVDPSFRLDVRGISIDALAQHNDGSILFGGNFIEVNGTNRANLARIDSTGALDTAFKPEVNGAIYALEVLSSGKILIGGAFSMLNGVAQPHLARLNADGSLDASFTPTVDGPVYALLAQGAGLLIGGTFSQVGATPQYALARVTESGANDPDFVPELGANSHVHTLVAQSEEHIVVAGTLQLGTATRYLAQLSASGVTDPGFSPSFDAPVLAVKLSENGWIYVGGEFTQVNGVARRHLARLGSNGTLNTFFSPPPIQNLFFNSRVTTLAFLDQNIILAGGDFSYIPDDTLLNNQSYLYTGIAGFSSLGRVQPGFQPQLFYAGNLSALVSLPDGRSMLGGLFSYVNGRQHVGFAQLDAVGEHNLSYPTEVSGSVSSIVLLPDGKQIIGGSFFTNPTLLGVQRSNLARLNPLGHVDPSFHAMVSAPIYNLAAQADGKVLVHHFNERQRLIRLHENGDFDPSFSVSFDQQIDRIVVQPDGKILIAGNFSTVNGVTRHGLARLNTDGSLDASFNVRSDPGAFLLNLLLQDDGKILIGGFFTQLDGQPGHGLMRLNADGNVDPSFVAPANLFIRTMALQRDGGVLVASEQNMNPGLETLIMRLGLDGALDSRMAAVANGFVTRIAVQSDDKVLLAGNFSLVNGIRRNGVARLLPDSRAPAVIALSTFNVAEQQPAGTLVGLLRVVGALPGENYRFKLIDGHTPRDQMAFRIDGNRLLTTEVFDYEQQRTYGIRIQAQKDYEFASIQQNLIIGVLKANPAPSFSALSAATGASGSYFHLRASGLPPNTVLNVSGQRLNNRVNAAVLSTPSSASLLRTIALGTVTTDTTGTVELALFFPPGMAAGNYLLSASDGTTTLETTITLDPAAEVIANPGTLPVLQFVMRLYLPLVVR
jgi:uncharacterized delta-60 repeat protein